MGAPKRKPKCGTSSTVSPKTSVSTLLPSANYGTPSTLSFDYLLLWQSEALSMEMNKGPLNVIPASLVAKMSVLTDFHQFLICDFGLFKFCLSRLLLFFSICMRVCKLEKLRNWKRKS